MLVANRGNPALGEQQRRVVNSPALRPRRGHEHRPTSGGVGGERRHGRSRRVDHRRTKHEVLRRIPDRHQLSEYHEVAGTARGPGGADLREIAVNVADDGIELSEPYL